jgi:5-formyltetrahydrofolate cyclo-ligase
MTLSVEDAKAAIRREAKARRDALSPDVRAAAAQAVAARSFPASCR